MGESIAEATITNWLKQVGDPIEADDVVLEIATDKVDSEVLSEVSGILIEQLFRKNDVIQVGQTIAIIETDSPPVTEEGAQSEVNQHISESLKIIESTFTNATDIVYTPPSVAGGISEKFFSPLVKNIATAEGITNEELNKIIGSGNDGRVTKEDILTYIQNKNTPTAIEISTPIVAKPAVEVSKTVAPISINGGDEIIEMDRMRKLIAGYMVASIQTSAHVQSFIEVDVTNIVKWRDKVKNTFEQREGEKLTFTPIFMEAIAKALKDFPMINISVDGDTIIKRKNINLGMAAALPNGNLIVPVIKNADQLNLVGMAKAVNDLGNRAKLGKLKPDDTQGGTYTVSNIGSFGSIFGTPIINQPQVGILAIGAIRKVPAVIETPQGDFIGIRQKMFLSHSYDHRVVDGALGGNFVKRVAEYLENFDVERNF